MLHEILLSLSGHPSPLLTAPINANSEQVASPNFPLLSPSEISLLASLAHLSDLHRQLKVHTSLISSNHVSTICRAVSTAIVSRHLAQFQQKILEVEGRILTKDPGAVGGYDIVPLSWIVGEFDEWVRRMEWFWKVAQFMFPVRSKQDIRERGEGISEEAFCTGAAIINLLREEAQTGYPDLEVAALDLVGVAETAWLRQLSTWILYGRIDRFGAKDFFIREDQDESEFSGLRIPNFSIDRQLYPKFVARETASSILFIGRSLNHVRARGLRVSMSGSTSASSSLPDLGLLPAHLRILSELSKPISPSRLSNSISAIRLFLSQNTLQQLLPLPKILEVLTVLGDFFLLKRGGFAIALINAADEHLHSRHKRAGLLSRHKGLDDLAGIVMKDGELSAVLARTWTALSALRTGEDDVDETFDLARDLVHLSIPKSATSSTPLRPQSSQNQGAQEKLANVSFNDLLFSSPTTLSLNIPSPLDLFLIPQDIETYSIIHAYLLAIRRAHLRLTDLWKHTSLRRQHTTSVSSSIPDDAHGADTVLKTRQRSNDRSRVMRPIWAVSGAAVFLLAEIGSYFEGEVVEGSWNTFRTWLLSPTSSSGLQQSSASRPSSSSSANDDTEDIWLSTSITKPTNHQSPPTTKLLQRASHDPETLSHAHTHYLASLSHSLLLTSHPFTRALRTLLHSIDHLVALISRLETVQEIIDLETSTSTSNDTFSANSYQREDHSILISLSSARESVESAIKDLITKLQDIDAERVGTGRELAWVDVSKNGQGGGEGGFVPWSGGGVDRLLMKLDFGTLLR
ncbi:MAG: hypothetical protein M1827_002241 [Pycnora praestabilis]|nr:MAG: hypothetical protein M1827_002241 [Pycnora praestabilis]